MKFFFPDSQDQIDPSFDFASEERSPLRLRHRDDHYAHEEFTDTPFDGLLISKAMVEGGRYTLAQRNRLIREGVQKFYRLENLHIQTLGDCGAFSYAKEEYPPYSVDDVLAFYAELGFDYGISVDHVIEGFNVKATDDAIPADWKRRQEITLTLADEFLRKHQSGRFMFEPLGVAQGWSPKSYAYSVCELQKMGYTYIAMGGMVPLKTHEIMSCLTELQGIRNYNVKLHLLGITRCEQVRIFRRFGVASFDSTSPLRQAFKDLKDNYYTLDRTYSAIRVPQVHANPALMKNILAGRVDQAEARDLECRCMKALMSFDNGSVPLTAVLEVLTAYERLYDPKHNREDIYRETLADAPWKSCPCNICSRIGIHVVLFRGAERNRSRGFHNVFMFHKRLHRELSSMPVKISELCGRDECAMIAN